MEPANYDITIHQGATFEMPLHFKDNTGASVNMTGYQVEGQVWDRLATVKWADFTNIWTAQASGQFVLSIPANITATLNGFGQYDVLVTEPDDTKFYLLQGLVTIDPGLTG